MHVRPQYKASMRLVVGSGITAPSSKVSKTKNTECVVSSSHSQNWKKKTDRKRAKDNFKPNVFSS